jgi:hypothetical protein
MTRAVRGVLIAVPESTKAKGGAVHEAVEAAEAFDLYLGGRFPGAGLQLVTPRPDAPVTKARVLKAFEDARGGPCDLFVVMFFGHGLPADAAHPYQGWALAAEELTDGDLAAELRKLPSDVETVVICTCCYGRGFYYVGPRALKDDDDDDAPPPPEQPSLEQLSRSFTEGLQKAVDASMLCISAAGNGRETQGIVLRAVARQLLAEVVKAAEDGVSYTVLADRFNARRAAGHEFYVDSRPEDWKQRAVFAREVLPSARDGRAAAGIRR